MPESGPVEDTDVSTLLPRDVVARYEAGAARLRETARCRAAAVRAQRAYPGPLGEFVHRELVAYADFGYCFADGLVPRLIDALLAGEPDPDDPAA